MGQPTDYKAAVCVFLYGANDNWNTVLATDSASWATYTAARGDAATGIALAPVGTAASGSGSTNQKLGGPLAIVPNTAQSGRTFALHPSLPRIKALFDAGKLGIVANVGNIKQPTTKADYTNKAAHIPAKLGSHNDQQAVAMTGGVEGTTRGWGGKAMDSLISANTTPNASGISVAGNTPWLVGDTARSYQITPNGPVTIGDTNGQMLTSTELADTIKALMRATGSDNMIRREHAAMCARSIDTAAVVGAALPLATTGAWAVNLPKPDGSGPGTRAPTTNPLAAQLQAVARSIDAASTLGMHKQIFFVGIGGWDFHDTLAESQSTLLGVLDEALGWFQGVLDAMPGGVAQKVTTFTMSDFGRALANNGDGCDHGWGSHHFVMGGDVKGKDIYGRFPDYGSLSGGNFTSADIVMNGHLIPERSWYQYAGTIAKWMGLTDAQIATIFPNIANFPAGVRSLGFTN